MCEDTFQVVVLDLATVGEVTGTWMKIDNGIYGMIRQKSATEKRYVFLVIIKYSPPWCCQWICDKKLGCI